MRAVPLVVSLLVAVWTGFHVRNDPRSSEASLSALSLSSTACRPSWRACSADCRSVMRARGARSTDISPVMRLSVSSPDESPLSWIPAMGRRSSLRRRRRLVGTDADDLAERDRAHDAALLVAQLGAHAPAVGGLGEADRPARRLEV